MKRPLYLAALVVCLAGCSTTRLTYDEWQEKTRLEAEAKRLGVPFTYKSRAQLIKEAEEMRAIVKEVMNGGAKPVKPAPSQGK